MKFSIVVPIYKVEKELPGCLESIRKQTYEDFEVILVNDGSPDKCRSIMESFAKEDARFRPFYKKNGGLSDARNFGVKQASGDYLIFVDSDDTIEKDLLEILVSIIQKEASPDVIRYQIRKIVGDTVTDIKGQAFPSTSGFESFKKLTEEVYFEVSWAYAYRMAFFQGNHFQFSVGRFHEDFGLTPYLLLKANTVAATDYYGYRYLIRENSIITSTDPEKQKKRAYDVLFLYDQLKHQIKKDPSISKEAKEFSYSYLANALLGKGKDLSKKDYDDYVEEVRKRHIVDDLREDSMKHKIKKQLIKHQLRFYMKHVAK